MTVYIDLIMLLNFLVDYLLLLAVNQLAGYPSRQKRLLLSALLGALYSGLCLIPRLFFLGSPLWYLVFLALMAITAFGFRESALRRGALFLILSLALGGMAMALRESRLEVLLLEALALWLLTRISFGSSKAGSRFVPITVDQETGPCSFTALKDTGNLLRDPVTGESVIVVGPGPAEKLTGLTRQQLANPAETILQHPVNGLRLIPYSAIGQREGLLLGLRFPSVSAGTYHGSALLAFAPEGLGAGRQYEALTGGSLC